MLIPKIIPIVVMGKLLFSWLFISVCLISPHCTQVEASIKAVEAEGREFKLQIQHRDIGNAKLAIERSKRRLRFFDDLLSVSSSPIAFYSPLFSANGAYVTVLSMGTPRRNLSAVVDTGSDLVWCQCLPCKYCYPQNGTIFNPSISSTYQKASCADPLCHAFPQYLCNATCQYTYSYGDLPSTSGDLSYDVLTLTDIHGQLHPIPHFGFGCGHDNEGSTFADAGGLLGLGQGPLSMISQLSISKFSYCLLSFADTSLRRSPLFLGNTLTLSGYNMQSTPLVANPASQRSYYYVGLKGISVGGNLLNISGAAFQLKRDGSGGVVLDSGTTLTFLVDAAYKAVVSMMRSSINLPKADGSEVGLELCYGRSGEVPSLVFHLDGGADMALPPHNYFLQVGDLFCLGISKSAHMSILGNMLQQNFHILYDVASKKVSFIPTTCDQL